MKSEILRIVKLNSDGWTSLILGGVNSEGVAPLKPTTP